MKALSMPPLSRETSAECWRDILVMCQSPSKKLGIEVELTRDCLRFKAGTRGVARPFNAVDIQKLLRDYSEELAFKIRGPPNLNNSFDFFPYRDNAGKKKLSIHHTHISAFDFKAVSK